MHNIEGDGQSVWGVLFDNNLIYRYRGDGELLLQGGDWLHAGDIDIDIDIGYTT